MPRARSLAALVALAALTGVGAARANAILDPGAPGGLNLYGVTNLPDFGSPTATFGGMAIAGNTLYLSVGDPVNSVQTIWAISLTRTSGHITSLGAYSSYKTVSFSDMGFSLSGGLIISGGTALFTATPALFGQVGAAQTLAQLPLPAGENAGGLQYGPGGTLKLSTQLSGDWYTLTGSPGSYTIVGQASVAIPALSFDYIPADATFATAGMVLGDSVNGLTFYSLDGSGNPCKTSDCVVTTLVTSTGGDTIGTGVVRDALTGDILFSTYSQDGVNQLFVLSDTAADVVPEPSSALLLLAIVPVAMGYRFSRRAAETRSGDSQSS